VVTERCEHCGRKIKSKYEPTVCAEAFGGSDIDTLARMMYYVFHDRIVESIDGSIAVVIGTNPPWRKYHPEATDEATDSVVREFRNAAYAAASVLGQSGMGKWYGWLD